jgi:hypothetical protein
MVGISRATGAIYGLRLVEHRMLEPTSKSAL